MNKNTLGALIYLRIARFTNQSNELSHQFLADYGLTAAQFDVLLQLSEHQPVSQQELAEKVLVSPGGMSKMLKRLEQEGLIQRQVEWKTKFIRLSDKGQERLESVYPKQLAFQTSLFEASLTKSEQKELYKLVTKLQQKTEQTLLNQKNKTDIKGNRRQQI